MPNPKDLRFAVAKLVEPDWRRTDRSVSLDEVVNHLLNRLPHTRGVPANVRRMMASRRRPEHKQEILESVYGKGNVKPHDGNFLIFDQNQGSVLWADEKGLSMKDLIDFAPIAAEAVGGMVGAVGGAVAGGPFGAAAGGTGGATAARGASDFLMGLGIPEEARRTPGEALRDTGSDLAFNALFDVIPAARALRGVQSAARPVAREGVEAAARRGIPLTLGETTGSTVQQGVEHNLGRVVGAGGPVDRFVTDRQQRLVQLSDEIGVQLSGGSAPADKATADAMVKQIAGEMDMSYRETLEFLETNLERQMGAETLIEPTATLGRLQEVTQRFSGAADDLGKRIHGSVLGILQDVQKIATAGGGRMSFGQLRSARTLVNDAIRHASQQGAPVRDLKNLAGYMTSDLGEGVSRYGSEEANRAWRMVNQHISSWMDETNPMNLSTVAKVIGKDGDQNALRWAMAENSVEGSRRLTALRAGSTPDEWNVISSSVWNDLGMKEGEWVPATFLRNYGKMSPTSRKALWGGSRYEASSEAMQDLASVLGMFKAGKGGLNFSNTAPALANKILTLGAGVGAGALGPGAVLTATAAVGANNMAARAFRNEAFIRNMTSMIRILRRSPVAKHAMIRRLMAALSNEPEEVQEWFLGLVGEDLKEIQ